MLFSQQGDISKSIYEPNICANPTDLWLGEVRNGGWLIDRYRGTEAEVKKWLTNHAETEISPSIVPVYAGMLKRWANK